MKRKVLAIFFIVTMLFSLVPTAALAADTGVDYTLVFYGGKVYQDGDIRDNFYGTEMTAAALAELGITTGSGYTYTFNNVNFSTSASTAIEIRDDSAIIVLEGANAVTGGESSGYTCGIETYGNLTITSSTTDGTLEVTAGKSSNSQSDGIYVGGNFIVDGEASVTGTGGTATYERSNGIWVNGELTVSDTASVTGIGGAATYERSNGIWVYNKLTVSGNASVTATGGEASIASHGIYVWSENEDIWNFEVCDNGSVNATAGASPFSCAISANSISITGGKVTADATASTDEGYGLEYWNNANISGGIVILRASTYASAYWTNADGDVAAAPSTEGMAVTAGESSDGSDAKVLSNWNDDGSDDVSIYKYMKFEPSGSVGGEEDDEDDDEDTTSSTSSSGGGFTGSYNYPITISSNDNGSAILSDSNAVAGETVTITTDPDAGYGVSEVVVTDKDGNAIEVTALGNGQYTFVMQEGGADVQVVYKPAITLTVGSLYIDVFGKLVKNDVTAILTPEGRMMLPIRVIAEALGADVDWDPDLQKVTITKGDTIIEIFIGAEYAYVNGEKVALDSAAFIKDNRTYLPVRFVSEYLGADVNWYAGSKTVTIVPYDVK